MRLDEAKEILFENGYVIKSKLKLKNDIYNAISPYTKNVIKWDNFSQVINIQEAIRDLLGDTIVCDVDGGNDIRVNKDGLEYREFNISIYSDDDYKMILEGKIDCNAAGTKQEPWKLYDISVLLY